jgi:hypothetical protein
VDKCKHCPLRDESIPCYAHQAGLCFHLDPESPRYNPAYKAVFIKQSRVEAGLATFEPPNPSEAPAWLRSAMASPPSPSRPSLPEKPAESLPGGQETSMQAPGLWRQAKNFADAVVRHALDGFTAVSDEKFRERLAICEGCEFFKDRKCLKCGCLMDVKARWASEKCPIDKWPAETDGGQQLRPFAPTGSTFTPPGGDCGCRHS